MKLVLGLLAAVLAAVPGWLTPSPAAASRGAGATALRSRVSPARRTSKPDQLLSHGGGNMALQVSSKSFPAGGDIPRKFTCDGQDISPHLSWSNLPLGTSTVAVLTEDPDAPGGTFTHWVAYDLPPGMSVLAEGVPKTADIPGGGLQGVNDFGKIGYAGPCPPPGKPHRYSFKVYALDTALNLKPGASKRDVERALRGHVLAQGEVMGRFGR